MKKLENPCEYYFLHPFPHCYPYCIFTFSKEILTRIENVILGIVTSLSKDEAPVLALPNRSSWSNIR